VEDITKAIFTALSWLIRLGHRIMLWLIFFDRIK
jgi:hypothetical protein